MRQMQVQIMTQRREIQQVTNTHIHTQSQQQYSLTPQYSLLQKLHNTLTWQLKLSFTKCLGKSIGKNQHPVAEHPTKVKSLHGHR